MRNTELPTLDLLMNKKLKLTDMTLWSNSERSGSCLGSVQRGRSGGELSFNCRLT
jgi:hypothetical protein